jgi:hypothetical protein
MKQDDEYARQLTAIAELMAQLDPRATAALLIELAARFDSGAVLLHVPRLQ